MKTPTNYIDINKQSWNNRVATHLQSEFYNMDAFINGTTSLNKIELDLLGDVKGKSILHLQCHFGQDSISLSRMGAFVTGVDLSDKAIEEGQKIAKQLGTDTQFVCCNIYDIEQYIDQQFDIIFTSYGTIGWLPDLDLWAKLIHKFLKTNGKFIFVEFHPIVWMFDDNFEKIQYPYFNVAPIIETESGTYADRNALISQDYVTWNHSLSEVISNLIANSLTLKQFQEFDYSPYNCFNQTIAILPKQYQIKGLENKIPMVYALVATK